MAPPSSVDKFKSPAILVLALLLATTTLVQSQEYKYYPVQGPTARIITIPEFQSNLGEYFVRFDLRQQQLVSPNDPLLQVFGFQSFQTPASLVQNVTRTFGTDGRGRQPQVTFIDTRQRQNDGFFDQGQQLPVSFPPQQPQLPVSFTPQQQQLPVSFSPQQPQQLFRVEQQRAQRPRVQNFRVVEVVATAPANLPVPRGPTLDDLIDEEWNAFKITYNKSYNTPEEEQYRRGVFVESRSEVNAFNEEYGQGRRTYVMQLNAFADMLHNEFQRRYNGYNRSVSQNVQIPVPSYHVPTSNSRFADKVDWRNTGAVTSVKDQGLCAGCWAYAAVGAMEGQVFRKFHKTVELSPQQLIDCSQDQGNDGCAGGTVEPAYEHIRVRPGLDSLASYPTDGSPTTQSCKFRPEGVEAQCTGYVNVMGEKNLEDAVATKGPIAAAVYFGQNTQFYRDGIYRDPECLGKKAAELNHAVLVVGYDQEPSNGQKYWIIKNTYGPAWGIGGYMKLAKDEGNHCGIATQATYPLV